jgi:hypothetical protein
MKLTEEDQQIFVRGMIAAAVVGVIVFFFLLVLASALTILSINALMAYEFIPLTYTSVFALAWMKFVTLWLFNRVSITRKES